MGGGDKTQDAWQQKDAINVKEAISELCRYVGPNLTFPAQVFMKRKHSSWEHRISEPEEASGVQLSRDGGLLLAIFRIVVCPWRDALSCPREPALSTVAFIWFPVSEFSSQQSPSPLSYSHPSPTLLCLHLPNTITVCTRRLESIWKTAWCLTWHHFCLFSHHAFVSVSVQICPLS